MKSTKTPKLLVADDYVKDAIKAVNAAKDRICLLTMIISYDELTKGLIDAITNAKQRGVKVDVAVDTFTYLEIGGNLRFNTSRSQKTRSIDSLKRTLKSADIKVNWLGRDTLLILSGRTHCKWLIVDDTAYTFGGVNLYGKGVSNTDFMLRYDNKDLSDYLIKEYRRIVKAEKNKTKYRSHYFDTTIGRVLIDGGRVSDSIIYRRAKQLIADAESVVYVSQYCPTGKLAQLLKNKPARLYFNPWQQSTSMNALFIRISSWRTSLKTDYSRQPYIHGKFIICSMPGGSKVAITGSHNFAGGGVWLGTREIALETDNAKIIRQLEDFVATHIA